MALCAVFGESVCMNVEVRGQYQVPSAALYLSF